MLNKSTTNNGIKNCAFTPNEVKLGLKNIPYNYILKVQEVLDKKIDDGLIAKNFSKTYIAEVRKGEKFNADIMNALVQVGLDSHSQKKQFGFNKKKTPSAR